MPIGASIGAAVVGAGASIFNGSQQAAGNDKALAAQTTATNKQLALFEKIFTSNKKTAEPWQKAGLEALKNIQTGMKDGTFDMSKFNYKADPGYQFRLKAGENAMEQSAAARGKLLGGDQQKALTAYGQDMASQEYNNAYSRAAHERDLNYARLADMAGRGQSADATVAGVTQNYASQVAGALQNQGAAAGTAAINNGKIWGTMGTDVATSVNGGIENYMLLDRLGDAGRRFSGG